MMTLAQRRRALPLIVRESVVRSGPDQAPSRTIFERPTFVCQDNQGDLVPRVMEERARRALYAECERAPFGWEKR